MEPKDSVEQHVGRTIMVYHALVGDVHSGGLGAAAKEPLVPLDAVSAHVASAGGPSLLDLSSHIRL